MTLAFGASILSVGTVITLLYRETSRQHEYYFYYNKGLSKSMLILSCVIGNLLIGIIFISIYVYAQHP